MNSAELSTFKLNVVAKLIGDSELVALLDPNKEYNYPEDLAYTLVFPFERIPETEQETKSYITVKTGVPSICDNDISRNVRMTVRAITHESLMRVPDRVGTRIDLMSARIDTLLNESDDFGMGKVTLVSNTEYVLDSKHFYREMIFNTVGLNSRRYGA